MAELMLINPRRRRKATRKKARKSPAKRRRNPIGLAANPDPRRRKRRPMAMSRVRRARRRNPSFRRMSVKGVLNGTVMPAMTAAVGAIGLDVAWSYLPVPDSIKTGPFRHAAKGLGAIVLGMVAGMVVKKETADRFATGALTVVAHSALKEQVQKFAPNIQMGEYVDGLGYWSSGIDPNAGIDGMGEYLPGPMQGVEGYGVGEYEAFEMM